MRRIARPNRIRMLTGITWNHLVGQTMSTHPMSHIDVHLLFRVDRVLEPRGLFLVAPWSRLEQWPNQERRCRESTRRPVPLCWGPAAIQSPEQRAGRGTMNAHVWTYRTKMFVVRQAYSWIQARRRGLCMWL